MLYRGLLRKSDGKKNPQFGKNLTKKKYRAIDMKTQVGIVVAAEIKSLKHIVDSDTCSSL
jgi:hypothetical protein